MRKMYDISCAYTSTESRRRGDLAPAAVAICLVTRHPRTSHSATAIAIQSGHLPPGCAQRWTRTTPSGGARVPRGAARARFCTENLEDTLCGAHYRGHAARSLWAASAIEPIVAARTPATVALVVREIARQRLAPLADGGWGRHSPAKGVGPKATAAGLVGLANLSNERGYAN